MLDKTKVKKPVNIRILPKVWEDAEILGNRSQIIEDHLKLLTETHSPDIFQDISYCRLCKKKNNLKNMFKFVPVSADFKFKEKDRDDLAFWIFVCRDCFMDLKQNKIHKEWNTYYVTWCLACIEEEREAMKKNLDPEVIARTKSEDPDVRVRLYEEFETAIGVYDGGGMPGGAEHNSILNLIEDIKAKPLCRFKSEKGKLSVPLKDFYADIYE